MTLTLLVLLASLVVTAVRNLTFIHTINGCPIARRVRPHSSHMELIIGRKTTTDFTCERRALSFQSDGVILTSMMISTGLPETHAGVCIRRPKQPGRRAFRNDDVRPSVCPSVRAATQARNSPPPRPPAASFRSDRPSNACA